MGFGSGQSTGLGMGEPVGPSPGSKAVRAVLSSPEGPGHRIKGFKP